MLFKEKIQNNDAQCTDDVKLKLNRCCCERRNYISTGMDQNLTNQHMACSRVMELVDKESFQVFTSGDV